MLVLCVCTHMCVHVYKYINLFLYHPFICVYSFLLCKSAQWERVRN